MQLWCSRTCFPLFLICPPYTCNAKRISLINDISRYQPISLNLILYGNASLPYANNVIIFQKVQSAYYILNDLLNNTDFTTIYTTNVMVFEIDQYFAMLLFWCRCSPNCLSPIDLCSLNYFCLFLFFFIILYEMLIQLTNVCKNDHSMIICFIFATTTT